MVVRTTGVEQVLESPLKDGKETVKGRLHNLLSLAIAIGSREGLLREKGKLKTEEGNDGHKGSI